MAIESIPDRFVEVSAFHRRFRQALQQHLALVQKPGRAIAALERKMFHESLLQHGKLPVLCMALDRADRLAGEACRRNDARRAGLAGPVGVVDDHCATQALRQSATEFGTGEPQVLPQEIVHRQFVTYLKGSVRLAIDRDTHIRHESTPLSMVWVTGKDWKR